MFATEPLPPDHPFWHEPRIPITPHCSADTLRAHAVEQIAAKIGALERLHLIQISETKRLMRIS
ncbi:hypothetical protein [Burkholderia pseudomallei]|uniref:hypothetical protein n=1 Tax=Burkholderia pseudomallei TaxID=28450 RepID=UPI003F684341